MYIYVNDVLKYRNYIAGELKRASKTLPIVIHSSMGIVLSLMILTNWSYLIVLPMEVVTQSNTIGLEFGRVIFGPIGSFIFSLIVAFACFGALNSSVFPPPPFVFFCCNVCSFNSPLECRFGFYYFKIGLCRS
jgi:hypothetical protein